MSLTITAAPIGPAVDPEVVKRHLGIDHGEDDDTVLELIAAATELIQEHCEIQLLDAELTLRLDGLPTCREPLELPRPLVTSVESLTYLDFAGDEQSLDGDDYQLDLYSKPARLVPTVGTWWPATQCDAINSVTCVFRCGAATVDAVDPLAVKLIIHLCGLWYEHAVPCGSVPQGDECFQRLIGLLRWR